MLYLIIKGKVRLSFGVIKVRRFIFVLFLVWKKGDLY